MSLKNFSAQNKDVKRTKIELKEDQTKDTSQQSLIFEKITSDTTKDTLLTPECLKKIYSFNRQIGDAIFSILQFQHDFTKILTELTGEIATSKQIDKTGKDRDKILGSGILSDPVSPHETVQYDKSLLPSNFKLDKLERELQGLVNFNKNDKDSNKSSIIKSNATSPPISARNWDPISKRSSVPQVMSDPKKSKDFKDTSPQKLSIGNGKSMSDQRKNVIIPNSTALIKSTPNWKTNLPSGNQKPKVNVPKLGENGLHLLRKSQSPPKFKEVSMSNPSSHRDMNGRMKGVVDFLPRPQRNGNLPSKERKEKSKERQLTREHTTQSDRGDIYERKLSIRPKLDELQKKELLEESSVMEPHPDDKNLNSQDTSKVNNDETDRTLDDRQGHTMTVGGLGNPSLEKQIIKTLIKDEVKLSLGTLPRADDGAPYQRKYLIDAKWWRAWKEYVNFDIEEDSKAILDMKFYSSPGKILNKNLLKSDIIMDLNNLTSDIELKENLLEHHDYEAVSTNIFDTLSKWYGCDFEIVRMLKPDPFRNNKLQLDLYPNKGNKARLSDAKKIASGGSLTGENKVIKDIITSNLTSPNAFKKKAK